MKLTSPATSWEYSIESEIRRYFSTAKSISKYFFQKKGFTVFPTLLANTPKTVYFPDLPIARTPEFWDYISHITKDLNEVPELDPDISKAVASQLPISDTPYRHKKQWEPVAPMIFNELPHFFPKHIHTISHITIHPTLYGTVASATAINDGGITIFHRLDAPLAWISGALIISLLETVRHNGHDGLPGINWEERQSMGDFLMSQTALATILPGYTSTISSIRTEYDHNATKISNEYLTSLGFPQKQLFSLDAGDIRLNEKPLVLRKNEDSVLKLLIQKRHRVVKHEEIAHSLWGEERHERFSLYAIAKVIERIRFQIYEHGVHPGIIETCRGQGFVLND